MRIPCTTEFAFPAPRVWAVLRDFGYSHYLSSIFWKVEAEGSGIGMTRRLYRHGDNTPSIHRLEVLDDEAMHLVYTVLQSRLIPSTSMTVDMRIVAVDAKRSRGLLSWELSPPEDVDEEQLFGLVTGLTEAAGQQMNRFLERGGDRPSPASSED